MNTEMEEPFETQLRQWIRQTSHRSMKGSFLFCRENGLSISQLILLQRLSRTGSIGVSEISHFLAITNAAASQMLDKLVQMELVSRREDSADRRNKIHELTDKGRQMVLLNGDIHHAWLNEYLESFSPEEKNRMTDTLSLLVERLAELKTGKPCDSSACHCPSLKGGKHFA